MRLSRLVTVCFAAVTTGVVSGCGRKPAEPREAETSKSPAWVPPQRDAEALFQTDSLSYTLVDDGTSYYGLIAVRFTNQSGGTTYFVNCNGVTSYQFEKLVDGAWRVSFAPPINLCLSPPIVVTNGATHEWRIMVLAGHRGSNHFPQFDAADLAGIYRIVWGSALTSYQDRLPFGDPLPPAQRVSNRFALAVKRGVIPPPPSR